MEARGIAERLVHRFGSLASVLSADRLALAAALPDHPVVPGHLAAVREAMLHSLRSAIEQGPILSSDAALRDYLTLSMGHGPTEQFRMLFLNAQNRLLADEVMSSGSVSQTAFYPRNVVIRALELGATALIAVHNHPSGSLQPSREDIEATRRIVEATRPLDIVVHDHLIVAGNSAVSLRGLGLL